MTEQLKPQFFVIRHNGSMVPLIAMDEIPQTLSVKGVPRLLTPQDLSGMICVGKFDSRHGTHTVDNLNQSPNSKLSSEVRENTNEAQDSLPIQKDKLTKSSSEFDPQLPLPGKKEYCSHWIKRGECDFMQQGCIFKHEMPTDLQTLNAIGFKDIPQWYRQKYGVPSLLAVEGSDAALGGIGMRRRTPVVMARNCRLGSWNSIQSSRPNRSGGRRKSTSNRLSTTGKASGVSRTPIPRPSSVQKDEQSNNVSTLVTDIAPDKTVAKTATQKQDAKTRQSKREQKSRRDVAADYLIDVQEKCNILSLTPAKSPDSGTSSDNSRTGDDTCDASASSNGGSDDLGYETSAEQRDSPTSNNTLPDDPYPSYDGLSDSESTLDIEGEIVRRDAERNAEEEKAYAAIVAAVVAAAAKESQKNPPGERHEAAADVTAPPPSSVSVSSNDKQGQRRRPRGRRAGKKVQAMRKEGKQ